MDQSSKAKDRDDGGGDSDGAEQEREAANEEG